MHCRRNNGGLEVAYDFMSVIKAWIGISVIPSQRNQQYLKDSARRFEKIIIHPEYNAYDTGFTYHNQ